MAGDNHQKLLEITKRRYESIGRVFCPVLNSYVFFPAEGYRHLIYKPNRKKRTVKEQCYKLKLFGLATAVVKNAESIERWRFADEQGGDKDIQHYALVHAVGRKPIPVRVVIIRTGDGQFNFHSVMIKRSKKRRILRRS